MEIIPPGKLIKKDRPRLLLRPHATPHAISLDQLKAVPRDADVRKALAILSGRGNASAQAMVWLMTGEAAAAEKALALLKAYKRTASDAFDVWFGLRELALAYDWLYNHPKFTDELKKHVRDVDPMDYTYARRFIEGLAREAQSPVG